MIEIICQWKSPSEVKAKCIVTEILLTELLPEKISTDKTINVLNAIGGIYIAESEE
jgi:hypothetical protein